jgi:hypothetical protein
MTVDDFVNGSTDWESMARKLRGGLRTLRAGMDLTMDEAANGGGFSSREWSNQYNDIRESINDILREIVGE